MMGCKRYAEVLMSESWFYHISQVGKLSLVETVEAALAAAKNGGFLWLHYCQPTKEELSNLIDPLGLHPLSIEDCFPRLKTFLEIPLFSSTFLTIQIEKF
jgi:Mg2+ and Co2+ transporter CorA